MGNRVLYIEDMERCHKLTRNALEGLAEVDSVYTKEEAKKIIKGSLRDYDAIICDVNLVYDENKPDNEQTTEGLELIALSRKTAKECGLGKLPIFCISSEGRHKKPALKAGANIFLWKRVFWGGKGREYLEAILKHLKRDGRQQG